MHEIEAIEVELPDGKKVAMSPFIFEKGGFRLMGAHEAEKFAEGIRTGLPDFLRRVCNA
jgi:hypothetical protein